MIWLYNAAIHQLRIKCWFWINTLFILNQNEVVSIVKFSNVISIGIRMGSLGLFLQCATSTFFSLAMSRLVRLFGSRTVYLSSMVCFTISALVICLSKSVLLVTAMSALTGFAYATLQTLPYTLTCHYHKEKEVGIKCLYILKDIFLLIYCHPCMLLIKLQEALK